MNSLPRFSALSLLSLAGWALASTALLPTDPPSADLDRARGILRKWETESPEKTDRRMVVVYWTPADREPQPEYRARLTRVMQSIENFYAAEMDGFGFPGRSIRLDMEADGLLRLPVVKGRLLSADCSEADGADGREIQDDCLRALSAAGIDGRRETVVIFCNLAEWDAVDRRMSHHSPYYASGDSRSGTAWQVDSPLLDPALLAVRDEFLTDGQYGRISLGRYNSIFVGGVCHEIGHALGLPHCRECAASRTTRGTALMGSGNRSFGEELRGEGQGSFLTLPHALKLAAHPQFSGSGKARETRAEVTFSDWALDSTGEGLTIRGRLQANLPVHGVLAYGDPEGGGDYDAAIAAGVPAEDGSFTVHLPLAAGARPGPALLSIVGVCANGAATAGVWSRQGFTIPCRIDDAGHYDISRAAAGLQARRHAAAAATLTPEILASLRPEAREALRRLALPDNRKERTSPALTDAVIHALPLSDAAPEKASTGYGGIHCDRTPERQPLIGPEGLARHGLWAHADSAFAWDLGGKWKSLTGSCALLPTGDGPFTATILTDGKQIWESGELKAGASAAFTVDLSNARSLTLETRGVDGSIRSAHAAWLEPVLSRE